MHLTVKHFQDLTADELFAIYRLRVAVFVVEQRCPYQEVDEADRAAYHVWLSDEQGIQAYLRVLPAGVTYPEASVGRVIAARRREGLGTRILREGIRVAKEKLNARSLYIGAQTYARGLYEKAGFVQASAEYMEDGIPHIHMRLSLEGENA